MIYWMYNFFNENLPIGMKMDQFRLLAKAEIYFLDLQVQTWPEMNSICGSYKFSVSKKIMLILLKLDIQIITCI